MKELIEAGLHFGHAASSWNPKMAPYLFGKRKKIHIFDIKQTAKSLIAAVHLVNQMASEGKRAMFVGTKIQAQELIKEAAVKTNSYYVNERWLGGLLTNLEVILKRLGRLDELEEIFAEEHSMYSKKALSSLKREHKKLVRDLGGVRGMERLPDFIVLIDPDHEHIAVKEAKICKIPSIALTDSNCNPDPIDLVIPGNDDAVRSIKLVLDRITDSILDGQKSYEVKRQEEEAAAAAEEEKDEAAESEEAGAEESAAVESEENKEQSTENVEA